MCTREMRPIVFGTLLAKIYSSHASAPGPLTIALAKADMSNKPTFSVTCRHSLPTNSW